MRNTKQSRALRRYTLDDLGYYASESQGVVKQVLDDFYAGRIAYVVFHGHGILPDKVLLSASPKAMKRFRVFKRKK